MLSPAATIAVRPVAVQVCAKKNPTPLSFAARSIGDNADLRDDDSLRIFKLHHYDTFSTI